MTGILTVIANNKVMFSIKDVESKVHDLINQQVANFDTHFYYIESKVTQD